jgi:hypothetical protein
MSSNDAWASICPATVTASDLLDADSGPSSV